MISRTTHAKGEMGLSKSVLVNRDGRVVQGWTDSWLVRGNTATIWVKGTPFHCKRKSSKSTRWNIVKEAE